MSKRTQCPGCGGPVSFTTPSAMVLVCEHCGAIVARTELSIEQIGKVAAISASASPLTLGLKGLYGGKSFHLVGHTRIKHEMGGEWEEWYAAFSNERWGWLAEAQGRYYMTFQQRQTPELPPFEQLVAGKPLFQTQSGSILVQETGVAEIIEAAGELPFALDRKTYRYADLSGKGGEFGTLSYATVPPSLFLGKEVTLADLGISPDLFRKGAAREKTVTSAKLACPKCGGAVQLRAPDRTERVICQHCASMLDVEYGNLRYLETLKKSTPLIPLGATGEFENVQMMVVGYMKRSTVLDGETWYWQEYLLYNAAVGYRWLVFSDDEWLYVKPLAAADVTATGRTAKYNNRNYTRIQQSTGRVEAVLGEFYWKVTVGETVAMEDFQSGSSKLSKESSTYAGSGGGEVNWSHGNMLSAASVHRKFGLPYSQLSMGAGQPLSSNAVAIAVLVAIIVIWVLLENLEGTSGGFRIGGSFGGFGGGK